MRSATIAAAVLLWGAGVAPAQDLTLFSFASGGITGGYYDAARAICSAVNEEAGGAIYCSPEPTSGSLYNLDALARGDVEFALVQSDLHRYAHEGSDIYGEHGPIADLRSVMSLYPEAVTILAHHNSGIERGADLYGKRIDIGHPTSGRHATLRRLMSALEIDQTDFAALTQLSDSAAISELCGGRIDAVVLIVGHPNQAVARALRDCDVTISPFDGPAITSVLGATTDYSAASIPRSAYPELDRDVSVYAVAATIVTLADADPDLVEALVTATLSNLDALGVAAPVLSALDPAAMMSSGLTAPMHDAARAVFDAFGVAEEGG